MYGCTRVKVGTQNTRVVYAIPKTRPPPLLYGVDRSIATSHIIYIVPIWTSFTVFDVE